MKKANVRKKNRRTFGKKIRTKDWLNLKPDAHYFVTNYLLQHYPTHNLRFPIPASKINPVREALFLCRFQNPNNFGLPIPNLRNIDLGT